MKPLLFLIALFVSFSSLGQELNESANYVKENWPEDYQGIKTFSINKWEDDHRMVLSEINKQTEAYIVIFKDLYSDENLTIFLSALKKWGYNGIIEGSSTIDWRMVKHEMEKQIKAKAAY